VRFQAILVGGGLANSLAAYRLAQTRPDVHMTVVEPGELGGNHTWCFHETDLTRPQREWIAPFVVRRWDSYEIKFPDRSRKLALPYCCITAERLREIVGSVPQLSVVRGRAAAVGPHTVTLEQGDTLTGTLVLDGRGATAMDGWGLAWQAFVGLELKLAAPHGLPAPIVMDATVPQDGAYRFIYSLPFTDTEILVEDTRYQDDPGLDMTAMRANVLRYARARGWRVQSVLREEHGVLPIVLSGGAPSPDSEAVPVGMRAGLFHQVTGYSLPDAVRLADRIAAARELTTESLRPATLRVMAQHWRRQSFYRLLNRMLFMAGAPDERWRILSRFYGLSENLVARFYAGETTSADMARILTGRPPVSVRGALSCLHPSSASAFIRTAAQA